MEDEDVRAFALHEANELNKGVGGSEEDVINFAKKYEDYIRGVLFDEPEEVVEPEEPKANLGLATTGDLLTELKARAVSGPLGNPSWGEELRKMGLIVDDLLQYMPPRILEYKTFNDE